MSKKRCPECGQELSAQAEFCNQCGSELHKSNLIQRLNNSVNLYSIYISLLAALILTLPVFLLLALGLSSNILGLEVVVAGTIFSLLFMGGFINALLTTRQEREAAYSGVFLFLVLLFNLALLGFLAFFGAVITASLISSVLGGDLGVSPEPDFSTDPSFTDFSTEELSTGEGGISTITTTSEFTPQFSGIGSILKILISLVLILVASPLGGVVAVKLKKVWKG